MSDNLIGEGRNGYVYKGVLKSVEHIAVVKVLNVQLRGANKSFYYVRNPLPQRVMDMVDLTILLDQEEHGSNVNQSHSRVITEICLASIFEVGILCSKETS